VRVLVLGAGVVGVATAYRLARDGHEVTVVDRQPEPARETSFANAGLIAPGHAYPWASPEAPKVLLRSLFQAEQPLRLRLRAEPRMWRWLALFLAQCTAARAHRNTVRKLRLCLLSLEELHRVVDDTGIAYDGRRAGNLYLFRSHRSFEHGVAHSAVLREQGLELEAADPDRVAELEPALAPVKSHIAGALYSPGDESGDARLFTVALARYARERLGVRFHFETPVRALDVRGRQVARVRTADGELGADAYVVCLGCDAPLLTRPLGVDLPIYPVKGYSVTLPLARAEAAPRCGGIYEDAFVGWSRLGQRLRITSTAEFSGYDRSHRPEDFRTMLRVARTLFPDAADYDRPDYWAGLRPVTPNQIPILGATPYRNLYLNTGHGSMGWTLACGTARLTADVIAGREPALALEGLTLTSD